jgi:exodeoxyribonuclease VII small subunit
MTDTQKKESLTELSFEQAYARLEQILERMNSGKVPLEESLRLYEEADLLIRSCSERLNQAEKKVEILMKNRQGDLALDEQGQPIRQPFLHQQASILPSMSHTAQTGISHNGAR